MSGFPGPTMEIPICEISSDLDTHSWNVFGPPEKKLQFITTFKSFIQRILCSICLLGDPCLNAEPLAITIVKTNSRNFQI